MTWRESTVSSVDANLRGRVANARPHAPQEAYDIRALTAAQLGVPTATAVEKRFNQPHFLREALTVVLDRRSRCRSNCSIASDFPFEYSITRVAAVAREIVVKRTQDSGALEP